MFFCYHHSLWIVSHQSPWMKRQKPRCDIMQNFNFQVFWLFFCIFWSFEIFLKRLVWPNVLTVTKSWTSLKEAGRKGMNRLRGGSTRASRPTCNQGCQTDAIVQAFSINKILHLLFELVFFLPWNHSLFSSSTLAPFTFALLLGAKCWSLLTLPSPPSIALACR